jgi:lysozyme
VVKPGRLSASLLSLSAAALVGIAGWERYQPAAYLPTPQDVPTIGWGATEGVKPGDRTTPDRALIRLLSDAERHQRELRACLGDVPLHPHEWDAYVSWAYNVGTQAACSSTLARKLKADPPDYPGACRELLRWDRQAGRVLLGLTRRRQAEYQTCMGHSG